MQTIVVRISVFLLRKKLTIENKGRLLNAIMEKLALLPIRNIIEISGDSMIVRGKVLDIEEMNLLRESAKAALQNRAVQLVQDQNLYTAYAYGINATKSFDDLYASKMAVWNVIEADKMLKRLAGDVDNVS